MMRRWLVVWLTLLALALGAPAVDAAPDEGRGAAPSPKELPFRESPLISQETVARVAAVTLGGVALVWVGALGLRRFVLRSQSGDASGRRIRVLETYRLSP